MKGLEPSTFCMASAGDRSRPFAPVRSNAPVAGLPVQANERKRTRANAEPCHSCHRVSCPTSESRQADGIDVPGPSDSEHAAFYCSAVSAFATHGTEVVRRDGGRPVVGGSKLKAQGVCSLVELTLKQSRVVTARTASQNDSEHGERETSHDLTVLVYERMDRVADARAAHTPVCTPRPQKTPI
jgi:hypothetical protein